MSFYLIPFYSILHFCEKKNIINKDRFLELSLISIFVIICSLYFDYNYLLGGGFFIKISMIFFDSFYFFYLTSIIGLFIVSLILEIN